MEKVGEWAIWSLLFGLVPYAIALLMQTTQDGASIATVIGSGQLALTSIALLVGGIRELIKVCSYSSLRQCVVGVSVVLACLLAAWYGISAYATFARSDIDKANTVAAISVPFFVVSAFLSALSIAIAKAPPPSRVVGAELVGRDWELERAYGSSYYSPLRSDSGKHRNLRSGSGKHRNRKRDG